MRPLVSVIVPVFNAANYLSTCVESILSQSFKSFELLLINDGSHDKSGIICDEYAFKDNRIRVFHKENGGVSSARNKGLDAAIGQYIVFIDADDWVSSQYLEHLMNSDSDWVVSGIKQFNAREIIEVPTDYSEFLLENLPLYWNTPPIMNYLYCYPVAKRFKASIIQDRGIRFNESLFFSEDLCFNMEYLSFSKTLTNLSFADYMYRIEDITRDEKFKMSAAQLKTHYEYFEECLQKLYQQIGNGTLAFVQENTQLRMMRKFLTYLLYCKSVDVFSNNIRFFRNQSWSTHLLNLLIGRREKRVMQEAIRFPVLTYFFEIRIRNRFYSLIESFK